MFYYLGLDLKETSSFGTACSPFHDGFVMLERRTKPDAACIMQDLRVMSQSPRILAIIELGERRDQYMDNHQVLAFGLLERFTKYLAILSPPRNSILLPLEFDMH